VSKAADTAVTLIEGSDPALVAEALQKVVAELLGDDDRSLAVEDHGGEEIDLAAVADGCATPPFLVSRRIVVLRDVGRWNTEEVQPLLNYLENPLDSTALVLVAGAGTTAQKLAAAAKAKGRVVSTAVDSRKPDDWIRDRIRKSGLDLDAGAQERLKDHLGDDPSRLVAILDVLSAAYEPGRRLSFADIEPYLGQAGSVTPWAFTDSIDAGRPDAALEALHRLLEGGDRHPLVVLAILHRHVASLMKVDSPSIRTEQQAAVAMGIAPGRSTFPAKKALRSARLWGSAGIAEAISLVSAAETDLKGDSAWPGEAVLEVLVARLCRLARSGSASRSRPAATHR
jgi:DNA polymerase-3 subunit delta